MNGFVVAIFIGAASIFSSAFAAQPLVAARFSSRPAQFAPPAGAAVLVNQTAGATGAVILSQNFERRLAANDSAGADAFVVPAGSTWKIAQVVANGKYYEGSGPAASENVTFYADAKRGPGYVVKGCTHESLTGADNGGSFTITLPKACILKAGKYWISVAANLTYHGGGGNWGWGDATETGPHQADWENPGNGLASGCTKWAAELSCENYGQANGKSFELLGTR